MRAFGGHPGVVHMLSLCEELFDLRFQFCPTDLLVLILPLASLFIELTAMTIYSV